MAERDPAIDWLVRDIRGHLRKRPKRFPLSDAASYAHALYETNTANLPAGEIACAAGCGGCCCSQVGVESGEAFALLRHLQATRTPEQFAALMDKVEEVAGRVAALDPGARWEAQIPCVFLDSKSQSCTVYTVRPLACRGYNSTDLHACKLSTANLDHDHPIPADGERMVRAQQVRQALAEVTARLIGRDGMSDHTELHAGLTMAHRCDSELAWLRAQKRG